MSAMTFDGLSDPCVFFVSVIQEGQALVDGLELAPVEDQPVTLYSHSDQPVHLIVMGIGRDAAEAAVDYALKRWADQPITWVNFGIAGHRDYDVGSLHQIVCLSVDGGDDVIDLGPPLGALAPGELRTFSRFVEARPCGRAGGGRAVCLQGDLG